MGRPGAHRGLQPTVGDHDIPPVGWLTAIMPPIQTGLSKQRDDGVLAGAPLEAGLAVVVVTSRQRTAMTRTSAVAYNYTGCGRGWPPARSAAVSI